MKVQLAALVIVGLGIGCGENPNRMGDQAGNEPTSVTGGFTGINYHAIPANQSLGSQAVGRQTTLAMRDEDFVMNAAAADMAEGELGRLAWSNSSDSAIRGFGNELFHDQLVFHDELTKIAANNDITLPYDMDAQRAADVNRLVKLHGSDFDAAFVPLMESYTRADIAAFQTELRQAGDESIRWYAFEMLPKYQQHLEALQRLERH